MHCSPHTAWLVGVARLPSRRARRVVFGLALLASGVPAGAQEIEIAARGEHGHTLRIVLPQATSPEVAQELLWERARQACADRIPRYGNYRFDAMSPVGDAGDGVRPASGMAFEQELECVEYASLHDDEPLPFVPAPMSPPTSMDEETVRDLTLRYLSAVDDNRFDAAFAMMAPSFRPMMTAGNWRDTRESFNAGIDDELVRRVIRLTWYDDPAGAPAPGRYVAADYRGDHPGGAFYCGYLVWLLQADGSYRLVCSEEGQLSQREAARIPSGMHATVRTQLQCRD